MASTASGTTRSSGSTASQDALADASTLDAGVDDAALAGDVAADVAQTWFPPPIK